jgi:hypothetical protein
MNRILSIFLFPILVLFSVHIECSGYSGSERTAWTSSDYDNNHSLEVITPRMSPHSVVSTVPDCPGHELIVLLAETEIEQQEVNGTRKHVELSTFFTTDNSVGPRTIHHTTFNGASFTRSISNILSQRYHVVLGIFRI